MKQELSPPGNVAQTYWEAFYRNRSEDSGPRRPNELLTREVERLAPGRALDLGCAEGADATWLASRGWKVVAVDVSATALTRTARRAAAAGVKGRVAVAHHDLTSSFPPGLFHLVTAMYLQSPVAATGERERLLRAAAERVAPGGALLIVSHAGWPTWVTEPPFSFTFDATEQLLTALALDPAQWSVVTNETVVRHLPGPSGEPGSREDHVLHLRQIPHQSQLRPSGGHRDR